MKAMQRTALILALAGALAIPATTLLASEPPAQDEHAAHHPDTAKTPATTPVDMQTMRDRMRQIQQTRDPEQRKALIEAQMKDMEAMMQNPNRLCPMADGKGGMGMMGGKGGMGMMGDKCGKGMMNGKGDKGMMGQGMEGGMGMSGHDDMMAKRMEMMEKRMDMMQMRMGQGSPGGMGGGMQGGMGPGMNMPDK